MSIEVLNATFEYQKGKQVFENLGFSAKEGDFLCLLGSNGSGKSTLLKCLCGILKLKNGVIRLDGKDIYSLNRAEIGKILGFLPQDHNIVFPYTVFQVVLMGRSPHLGLFSSPSTEDLEIAEKSLAKIGISHLKEKPYTEISGGEKQLLFIARLLCQQSKILLLDEPTSHLDFKNQTVVLSMVKRIAESGMCVIMTSHFPNNAFLFSNKVGVIKDGNFLAFGKPEEVITEDVLSRAYDMKVRILENPDPDSNEILRVCIPSNK